MSLSSCGLVGFYKFGLNIVNWVISPPFLHVEKWIRGEIKRSALDKYSYKYTIYYWAGSHDRRGGGPQPPHPLLDLDLVLPVAVHAPPFLQGKKGTKKTNIFLLT